MEYYLAIKKNDILPVVKTCIGLEGIMLNEMSDRERQIPYNFTYVWNLKNKKTNIIKQKTHRYREETSGCQRWGWEDGQKSEGD